MPDIGQIDVFDRKTEPEPKPKQRQRFTSISQKLAQFNSTTHLVDVEELARWVGYLLGEMQVCYLFAMQPPLHDIFRAILKYESNVQFCPLSGRQLNKQTSSISSVEKVARLKNNKKVLSTFSDMSEI